MSEDQIPHLYEDALANSVVLGENGMEDGMELFDFFRRSLNWDPDSRETEFVRGEGPRIIRELLTLSAARIRQDRDDTDHIWILPSLCFKFRIVNSQIVVEVLEQLYQRFSDPKTFPIMVSHTRSSASDVQNGHQVLLFFLVHTHRSRQTFGGTRFADFFVDELVEFQPRLQLLLLQFGAGLSTRPAEHYRNRLLTVVCLTLVRMQRSTPEARFGRDHCRSLQVLLRAIPQLMPRILEGFGEGEGMSDFIRSVSEEGGVPELAARCTEPSELQHLCRCVIRQRLNANWNLPYGVFRLPLPPTVQRYINLE